MLIAAERGRTTLWWVKYLFLWGANLNHPNRNGEIPLHFATKGGHLETVQLLIDKGANLEQQDNNGATPLWTAASNAKRS